MLLPQQLRVLCQGGKPNPERKT